MIRGTLSHFLFLIIICPAIAFLDQKKIVVITASYNNSNYCPMYFESIKIQKYDNWTLIYVDDHSTDDTVALIEQYIQESHLEHKITLIKNDQRKGHLYNQYHAIHSCDKDTIIIIVDGDDWLAHEHVFETINTMYQTEDVWITYGQFWYLKKNKKGFCKEIPIEIINNNAIRTISWRTSHVRTFYAGLFQAIDIQDLLYNGEFFPKSADVATMFPMIEMAGTHVRFIPEVLYIYNDDNPLSYHHNPSHQRELEAYIRTLIPYNPLKEKIW